MKALILACAIAALAGAGLLLLGALVALLPRARAAAVGVQALGLAGLGGAAIGVLLDHVTVGAHFAAGVHPALGMDGLSAFFVLVLAVVGIPALVYAGGYLGPAKRSRPIMSLTGLFVASLVLVLAARDVTMFLAGWELMTLVPAAIILTSRSDRMVRRSAFVYLAVTHIGGVGVWVTLLSLSQLGAIGASGHVLAVAPAAQVGLLVAAVIGFGTKAGLMPMHSWLPRAHPVAPSHVSALMSGVMIKVALYGLIRVLEWSGVHAIWLGLVLLGVGALSAFGGVLYALFQHELKRLLAFHSIENVGIITLGLGAWVLLAGAGDRYWSALALAAALLHVLNHAIFKALLFMGAGAFEKAAQGHDLDRLGGLLRRMPWTGGSFLLGAMAIAGLPPLNGFVSEWLILQALIHAARIPGLAGWSGAVAAAALAATAALAVMCFVKVSGLVLLGRPRQVPVAAAGEVPAAMRLGMGVLAALCVLLGAVPALALFPLATLPSPAWSGLWLPGTGGLPTVGLVLLLAALTVGVALLRGRRRAAAPAPTWTCGQRVEPATDWTSSGFTKPLRLSWEILLRPARELRVERGPGVVLAATYSGHVPHLFDTAVYRPVVRQALRLAARARRVQSGSLRGYATYMGGLVVLLLILVRLGVLG